MPSTFLDKIGLSNKKTMCTPFCFFQLAAASLHGYQQLAE